MTQASLKGRIKTALTSAQSAGPMDLDALSNAIAGAVVAEIQANAAVTLTSFVGVAGPNPVTFTSGGGTVA